MPARAVRRMLRYFIRMPADMLAPRRYRERQCPRHAAMICARVRCYFTLACRRIAAFLRTPMPARRFFSSSLPTDMPPLYQMRLPRCSPQPSTDWRQTTTEPTRLPIAHRHTSTPVATAFIFDIKALYLILFLPILEHDVILRVPMRGAPALRFIHARVPCCAHPAPGSRVMPERRRPMPEREVFPATRDDGACFRCFHR